MDQPRRLGLVLCQLLIVAMVSTADGYRVGLGRADVTGPPVEIAFMGYAKMSQKGTGLHLRQFSRAVVLEEGGTRLVMTVVECGMMGHGLRMEVLRRLAQRFSGLYTEENVLLSGTHTHSSPGGFLMSMLFDLNTLGFVPETFNALASGIVLSIVRAHENLAVGRVSIAHGELLGANINRSPSAYTQNPEAERARYAYDVDKTMVQLRFSRPGGAVVGAFTWFAVHPVSMNNSNTLVSSDNLGVAALLLEKEMDPGFLPGKGPFVGAFVSSNLGDVSPNLAGPRCEASGLACDVSSSTCLNQDVCVAHGPGRDMFSSTRIIGERIFRKALELLRVGDNGRYLSKGLRVVHQYHDMTNYTTSYWDPARGSNVQVHGCPPAMGYSFAAGTTDGPGVFPFSQNIVTANPLWNAIRNTIFGPSEKQRACHHPKPIMITTGEMTFPFEWQPAVVSTQLAVLGEVAIACVPGEPTTMAGRRLRDALRQTLQLKSNKNVLITGLCNTYSDYITTPEEYQVQRYEGASTIFGPHTLTIYLDIFRKLGKAIMSPERRLSKNDPPLDFFNDLVSFTTPVIFDNAGWGNSFGDVLQEPPEATTPGQVVIAKFAGANPRNNLQHEQSYLTVERREGKSFRVVATDASWETRFKWWRKSSLLGTSEVEILWHVPMDTPPGTYRLRYHGHYRYIHGQIDPFKGTTRTFQEYYTKECLEMFPTECATRGSTTSTRDEGSNTWWGS